MYKNFSILRYLLLSAICFILYSPALTYAQKGEKLQVNLSAVQEGNNQVAEAEWASLKFNKGNPVYISFTLSKSTVKNIFYRVMLDSQIIEPNLLENYITLKNLTEGAHILKITATSAAGLESEPMVVAFNVVVPQAVVPPAEEKSAATGSKSSLNSPVLLYLVCGLCAVQLIVILLLILSKPRQKKPDESGIKQELKQSQDEYIEVYNFNKRLKDEIKDLKDYNEYLKKQKADLEANIKNLESINVNLLEQKEKLVESKRQLELLHTQKDELFAMAIHDIKNPLSAMRGYIELLNSYELNATEQHEVMTSLVSSSENVCKLTQSMCTIIAQERPEPTLKFAPSSMKRIIDEICNQNMSYAKAKSIKLFNKASVGLPDIAMDEIKIQEVIENLVNNAIKYGPADSTIEVRTFIKGNTLTVEVQDTGVGIPEADLKRAFQKGAILTPKPTGVEQSSGLGLWIVKRTIEEHNGKVWVNSKVGSGSTFGFELPMEVKDRKATMY
jgi:signal transduction histidine kinase